MPKLRNVVTGVVKDLPARYVGMYPYELVEEETVAVTLVTEKVFEKPKKKKVEYQQPAVDADGDGLVQDGTPFERPAGTELSPEELTAIEAELSE